MSDVMIDLETLSVLPNAAILTIGAVKFNRYGRLQKLEDSNTFYRRIIINSCFEKGLVSSKNTESWWADQEDDVKYEALTHPDRVPLDQALQEFTSWFKGSRCIWGNGIDFDGVIMDSAYRACDMEKPWKFWNTRDCRTIFDLAGVKMADLPANSKHHALHDAYRQVIGVKRALQ